MFNFDLSKIAPAMLNALLVAKVAIIGLVRTHVTTKMIVIQKRYTMVEN